MVTSVKSISEFDNLDEPNGNTMFLAHSSANGVSNTYHVTLPVLTEYVLGQIPGPYANNSAAATANVAIGSPYYDSSGNVKIRTS